MIVPILLSTDRNIQWVTFKGGVVVEDDGSEDDDEDEDDDDFDSLVNQRIISRWSARNLNSSEVGCEPKTFTM